jgi:SAM-dependent methyltransferase
MISIITATHNPKWLQQAWASIDSQNFWDWEWIICPNNGAVVSEVAFGSPQVHVVQVPDGLKGIGAIKKFAFSQGRGDILLELDHDDELLPGALAEVAQAFQRPEVGFVYSEAVHEGPFVPFDPRCGWVMGEVEYRDQKLPVPLAFEPSAASLSRIWYAPDHLRAWRRTVYEALGGHDAKLPVCDDHELLCRTYLATEMVHIPKPLYLFRITGENSQKSPERNKDIQEHTVLIGDEYLELLVQRWADLHGLPKIDLGGAFDCPPGYQALDVQDAPIIWDVERRHRLPFPDNSIGIIRAHDFLEHITDKQMMMREIHRVLVDGGWLLSLTPSTDGRGAWQDPTHVSFWNTNAMWYWTRPQQARYIRNTDVHFQDFVLKTEFPSDWHRENNIPYVRASLAAVKSDARRPHLNLWLAPRIQTVSGV